MSSRLKELFSHSFIYGVGSVLQNLLGFILIPLYTRHYTTEIFGVFSLIVLVGTLVQTVFCLGASSALSRSYYDDNGLPRKDAIGTSFTLSFLGAMGQIVLAWILAPHLSQVVFGSDEYWLPFALALSSSAINILNNLFFLIIRFEKRPVIFGLVNVSSFCFSCLLIWTLLVHFELGLLAPILGELVTQSLVATTLLYFLRSRLSVGIKRSEARLQLAFGFPVALSGILYYLLLNTDRMFINRFCSLSEVGIYSFSYKIAGLINVALITPFAFVWAPFRAESYRHQNADKLFSNILTYYFLVGAVIVVSASIFLNDFLALFIYRKEYLDAERLIPIIMLSYLMYGAINVVDFGMFVRRKSYYSTIVFLLALVVSATLNYLLIPNFGYQSAIFVGLFVFSSLTLSVYFVSKALFPFQVEWTRLFLIFILSIAASYLGTLTQGHSPVLFVQRVLLTGAYFVGVIWAVLNASEKQKLLFLIRKIQPILRA